MSTLAGAMIRVLIADDHGVVRDGLGGLVGVLDDVELVAVTRDGEEAVERCRATRPDVVLMDLEMPIMDGIEATRRINAELPATAVLVLTSFSEHSRIVSALDAGARGYLLKDASAQQIADGIRAVARGESPIHPRVLGAVLAPRGEPRRPAHLTRRQLDILGLLAEALPNKSIATRMGVAEKTVKARLTRIYRAIGVTDRTQAALWAQRRGLGPPRTAADRDAPRSRRSVSVGHHDSW